MKLYIFTYKSNISTHILTRRMTILIRRNPNCSSISTHILTRRMTFMDAKISHEAIHFNSHPHEEDDFIRTVRDIYARYFNSHPHEEDDYIHRANFQIIDISTHILTRRMTELLCR